MTHTSEFLSSVFGAYIGCEIDFYTHDKHYHAVLFGAYRSIAFKMEERVFVYIKTDGDACEGKGPLEKCKLILTPLSDITDEHAIEIGKMVNSLLFEDEKALSMGRFILNMQFDISIDYVPLLSSDLYIYGEKIKAKSQCRIIDFLRSKGYHIPYMGVDLFQEGIAIQKNK